MIIIAVIVVTIVVSIGIGILDITLRDLILANIEKESLKAFYAADSGVDCAFHHDVSPPIGDFATPLNDAIGRSQPGSSSITCNGQALTGMPVAGTDGPDLGSYPDSYTTTLGTYSLPNGSCVAVSIVKSLASPLVSPFKERTEIRADGANTCAVGSRRVQRSLLLRWESI